MYSCLTLLKFVAQCRLPEDPGVMYRPWPLGHEAGDHHQMVTCHLQKHLGLVNVHLKRLEYSSTVTTVLCGPLCICGLFNYGSK